MKTLHLITQEGQPYGSVRRCCEVCGLMKTPEMLFTSLRDIFDRARENGVRIGLPSGVYAAVTCDRPPIAFKKWNDRPWHIEGNWGHDPGDEDAAR